MEQAPDILHQILSFEMVSNIMGIGLGIGFIIVGIVVIKMRNKFENQDSKEWMIFIGIIINCAVGIIICVNLYDLVKIWIAPKLFIIEYLGNIVN